MRVGFASRLAGRRTWSNWLSGCLFESSLFFTIFLFDLKGILINIKKIWTYIRLSPLKYTRSGLLHIYLILRKMCLKITHYLNVCKVHTEMNLASQTFEKLTRHTTTSLMHSVYPSMRHQRPVIQKIGSWPIMLVHTYVINCIKIWGGDGFVFYYSGLVFIYY